uniref:DNA-directed RNA polymerase III subunit RPC9 n=1 Tax=Lygus hesperus TaxID=30085 RepID=A0A146MAR1_LYGHE
MEVKQTEVAALCNLEVLNLLNEIKDTSVNNSSTGKQLATILYEASQHLQNSCGSQTPSDVRNLLGALLSFPVKLTHNEKLMIVNTPPKTSLELSLIVHNYDERMTEEQIEELIEIINNTSS